MPRYAVLVALVLLGLPSSGIAQAENTKPAGSGAVLDFQNADIRVVLSALAEAGDLNLTFSDLPPRSVTLRTNRPLSKADVRTLLDEIAASNGLKVRAQGSLLQVESAAPPAQLPSTALTHQQSAGGQTRLFVHRLKHAPAGYLASVLQALFGIGNGVVMGSALNRPPLSDQLRDQQIAPMAPSPTPVFPAVAPGPPGQGNQLQGTVQIVPDELTNALMIRASSADFEVIREAIQALDVRPLQVMIEVLIAEVRRTSAFDVGVSIETPTRRDPKTGALIGGKLTGRTAGDLILKVMKIGNIEADVLLSAFSEKANVSILSRPVIFAQNNQQARILVGSQRPFVQVFRSLPTESAVRDQVVQYRDVGTVLSILPTINEDGYVSLQLLQEVSTATNETQFGAPVISTREASTRLLVRDGQTVVIGGLVDRQRDRTRGGIPVLKDIPLLGALFGSTHRGDFQTEMFLFLTPHIVRTDDDAEKLREGLEQSTDYLKKHLLKQRTLIPDQPK